MCVEQISTDRIYIATAQAFDVEMDRRIKEHLARRGAGLTKLEGPRDLLGLWMEPTGLRVWRIA